jgi:hypothetical protein
MPQLRITCGLSPREARSFRVITDGGKWVEIKVHADPGRMDRFGLAGLRDQQDRDAASDGSGTDLCAPL